MDINDLLEDSISILEGVANFMRGMAMFDKSVHKDIKDSLLTKVDEIDNFTSEMVTQVESLSKPVDSWISCADRLPDADVKVLVCGASGYAFAVYGEFNDDWDGNYKWRAENYGHDGCDGKFEATHWQPIPQPPKSIQPI